MHTESNSLQPTSSPTHEEIANRAYHLWEKRGHPAGEADRIWSEAETELQSNPPMLVTSTRESRPPFTVSSNSPMALPRAASRKKKSAPSVTPAADLRSSTRATSADPDA